jgi:6-phosphogluconolactonase
MIRRVRFFDSREQFIRESSDIVREKAREWVKKRGSFHCAVSREQMPSGFYDWLGGNPSILGRLWKKTHLWFCDECFVSKESIHNSFGILYDSFIKRVPLRERFVHPVNCDVADPKTAAAEYEAEITETFRIQRGTASFDLVLLGVGADGHTAGLFPGKYPRGSHDLVVPIQKPGCEPNLPRISFNTNLLNQSKSILLLSPYKGKERIVDALVDRFLMNAPAPGFPVGQLEPQEELVLHVLKE